MKKLNAIEKFRASKECLTNEQFNRKYGHQLEGNGSVLAVWTCGN